MTNYPPGRSELTLLRIPELPDDYAALGGVAECERWIVARLNL
jgi:hypothetical protein